MKKPFLVIALLLIVVAGSFLVLKNDTSKTAEVDSSSSLASENTSDTETNEKPLSTLSTPSDQAAGKYVAYSDAAFEQAQGVKVLFFHAPWCRQCQEIEAGISEETLPSGVTFFKVDYDTANALRKEYGVTLQTTFVKVANDRSLIEKYVAYDEPTFDNVKRNIL